MFVPGYEYDMQTVADRCSYVGPVSPGVQKRNRTPLDNTARRDLNCLQRELQIHFQR